MTANRIKDVALTHFAEHGYEGASLASIAEEVGIKKPSIYAHFKGKEELFLSVIRDVADDELAFVRHYFDGQRGKSLDERLHQVLLQFKERYEHSDKTKFWLRMAFFPPASLHEPVMDYYYAYLDEVESVLTRVFGDATNKGEIGRVDAGRAAAAFMCLLDGVLVEMLYGGLERFNKRLDASWELFWRGLSRT